ncbi:MAG: aminopeptidase LapA [Legionellales bacterium]
MRINLFLAGFIMASNSVYADRPYAHEQLQLPQCLAQQITWPHAVLAENKQFQIIELLASELANLVSLADKVQCGHFINVSHKITATSLVEKQQVAQKLLQQAAPASPTASTTFYTIQHQEEVNTALNEVTAANIWQTLTALTSFYNRSATTTTGVATASWLQAAFEGMATASARTDTATFFVKTSRYRQPSLVTLIGKDIPGAALVLGAHMDTLDGHMPGAGDDGSGASSLMEMARVLLASKLTLQRPIYIIWYAAEERGLVGSQNVVQYFLEHNIQVKAAIQFDMTGYRVDANDPTMWVYTDYTDKNLNKFVAELIQTYIHVPVNYSHCGYGCSDHASWTAANIPAAFPCESSYEAHNPYIHTPADTMALLSLEHMTNFSKLALAFAIELAVY